MSEIPMGGPGIPLAPDAPGGPGAPESPPGAADEILVAFAEPADQRRLTVLVRLILAIPQVIVVYVLGIAAEVVALICWFAALFSGRLPDGLAGFQVGYLRWVTRFYAYVFLLTDVYPPFELADAQYPVRLQAQPGPLNRLAVLFRIILVIPAFIVATVLTYGLYFPVMFVTWLIVLVAGRMPRPLHEALGAAVRYQARVIGYFLMLTARYPGGLFGDPAAFGAGSAGGGFPAGSAGLGTTGVAGVTEAPGAASAGPWGAWGSAAPEGQDPGQPAPDQPGAGPATPGYGQPAPGDGEAAPGYGQPGTGSVEAGIGYGQPGTGYGEAVPGQPGHAAAGYGPPAAPVRWLGGDQPWRLVLSRPAQRLNVLFLGLGAVGLAGGGP